MDWDWAQIVKISLSCVVGASILLGCSVWFNYDAFDNPKDRYRQIIVGILMIIFGFSLATSYHYIGKSGNLPRFLVLTESEKAQERAEELKKAEAEEKERKRKEAEQKDVSEETGLATKETGMITQEVQSNYVVDKVDPGTIVETVTPKSDKK